MRWSRFGISFSTHLCAWGCALVVAWIGLMPNFVQAEGSASAAAGGLQDRFPGLSTLMDEDGAVAFFGKPMTVAPTPTEAAQAWLTDHGAALGVPDPDLRIERNNVVGVSGRTVVAYRQFLNGLPVEYGIARLLVREDRLSRVVFAAARLARPPKGGFAIDRVEKPRLWPRCGAWSRMPA